MTILAVHPWRSNAELIEACAHLGYLSLDGLTLDATYGRGVFWRIWQPRRLVTMDLKATGQLRADFTRLPFRLDRLGHRPQPTGRRQVHAHGRPSSLLIFRAPAAVVRPELTLFEGSAA